MLAQQLEDIRSGIETAYIDGNVVSALSCRPQFISNNRDEGKKVLTSIEEELSKCDHFQISVAFITDSGLEPLLMTLQTLESKGVKGEILTTNYLTFSEPKALKKLHELSNISLKMYDVDRAGDGFHTKGYIFKKDEIYRIIIGSSNITSFALTRNKEWNTKIVSTDQGEVAKEIVKEFDEFWNSPYSLEYEDFYENYKERFNIIKTQREIASQEDIVPLDKYKLTPNSMQVGFISNLRKLVEIGENRALLISATGTGKTYASAFAMRELGFKRVLFIVHRYALAKQARDSFKRVFNSQNTFGIIGSGHADYEADYIFAMVETLHKEENLHKFAPNEFDCIILDEAHHSPANTYQKVMEYFKPKLFLGMTATPDKRDDNIVGRNVYELFNYKIAYEIRLQQAMEEDLLCPFHYFGISDFTYVSDNMGKGENISADDLDRLTSDERVDHIIKQARFFDCSGDRVKGLIFCSRKKECRGLSKKFNARGYRTIALSGDDSDTAREQAFERLAMNEEDETEDKQPLDYIFSVDILNEGVDIVEVNQVIMLRPTQSPIVFIQQLGRGLRKASGKEYVVILDFIGNYNNNFMIPVALSGDRTYNPDTIRKYVISGNNTIPGVSTFHFDEIAKDKIFASIDRIRGLKSIIRESYVSLKNRLGRMPLLYDFYEQGEIDPLVIIKEYKSYRQFMECVERDAFKCSLSDRENLILEYLSKTILSGVRPSELCILNELFSRETLELKDIQDNLKDKYDYEIKYSEVKESAKLLQGQFTSNESEYQRYKNIAILEYDSNLKMFRRLLPYQTSLINPEFNTYVHDIINVGLARYRDLYSNRKTEQTPFVLYEKYSRRDVSLLMNCGKDLSSIMFGMWGDDAGADVFIFVTYHKETAAEGRNYVDGKPDYADAFEDNVIFRWDSKIGMDKDSAYMQKVMNAKRKHLFVKKSDAESSFYYMGQFDIVSAENALKADNNNNLKPITKVMAKMHYPVREDLLRYLQSNV